MCICSLPPHLPNEVKNGRDLQVVAVKSFFAELICTCRRRRGRKQLANTTTGAWGSRKQTHTDSESHTEVLVSVTPCTPKLSSNINTQVTCLDNILHKLTKRELDFIYSSCLIQV